MDVAFTLGLGAGLLIAAAVLAIMSAKNAWKYDERQRIARGEASAWALKLIVAANVAGILAQLLDLISTMTLLYLLTGAMIAAAALFAGICIYRDAWLAINERPRDVAFALAGAFTVNLALGFLEIGRIGALVSFFNFSVAAMLLSIAVNWYIKRRLDRRADDEEPAA